MNPEQVSLEFRAFRLDLEGQRLLRGKQVLALRPKTWVLLRHLAERPGQLLSKDELLDAVWPGVAVSQASLSQAILDLRRVLGDDARKPRFIETVHRRGFRFIAAVRQPPSPAPKARSGALAEGIGGLLPGREASLERLAESFLEARAGRRQIVFLTGEAGIGKTRLLRTFLERLTEDETDNPVRIAGASCVELHGEGEAYLPVLEVVESLARDAGAGPVRRALRRSAPTWLAQMPWLLPPDEAKQNTAAAATPTRMLREFCSAVEALSAERPLVLWLEDLHWSDLSTLDLLAALHARAEPARLLVLLTYRPVEAAMHGHPIAPLKRSLVAHHDCRELALELLDETAVRAYLDERFGPGFDPALATLIHAQTEGNPLFMVTLVDDLVTRGHIARAGEDQGWALSVPIETVLAGAPESLKSVVETRLDNMSPEEVEVLTAASAVGDTFAAQLVAAALGREVLDVEKSCGRLAGWGYFLEAAGPGHWPDGSTGERYHFRHAVFRSILHQRLAAAKRQELHHRIATRLEAGYASQKRSVAAELAVHFERGGDPERAVQHLVEAAGGVRQRSGDREAVAYFERALALLATLPKSDERDRRELSLRVELWVEVNGSAAVSSVDQDASLQRALELCDQLGDLRSRAYISSYQTRSLTLESDLQTAASFEEQNLEYASRLGDPVLLAAAHSDMGDVAFYRGEHHRAQRELARCARALESVDPPEACTALGNDPATLASGRMAWSHWLEGRPDEARREAARGLARSEVCGHPLNRAFGLGFALHVEQLRGDADAADALERSFVELLEDYGFVLPYPMAYALSGWSLAQSGEIDAAVARLREGVATSRRTGVRQDLSYLLAALARTELERGRAQEGLATVDEALAFVESTGERVWEAEIHRLNGELLLLTAENTQAEACFRRALEVAGRQGARSFELRAATSLVRLSRQTGHGREAEALLADLYGKFSEGLDTLDLRDAKALIDSA